MFLRPILANNGRFSLSDLFSLGSRPDRPDRPAHCSHLTIRTGNQPALRVGSQNDSGCPCQPAPLLPAQNRWPPAPTQPTDEQPAPGRDPSASSASIYNQQTVSKHGSQRFTSKSRPDMRVGVEDPTQPMWAASQTVRDPAGPYTRRAHSVCQTGSMGAATQTESKSRTGRHVTCPRQCFCLPFPQAQAFFADHIKVPVEPPGGVRRLESKDPRTAVLEVPPATSRAAMA